MRWIKLTRPSGHPCWVNLDAFVEMYRATVADKPRTILYSGSISGEDYFTTEVTEKPEEIMRLAMEAEEI